MKNKGRAFIDSGSFVRPNNYPTWNLTEVTGSLDSEYSAGDRKWAILTQMALTSSEESNVDSVFGVYEISEVLNMSFKCFQRFGPDSLFFRVTGVPEAMRISKGNPNENYDILVNYDVLNSDPEVQEQKIEAFKALTQVGFP